MTRDARTVERPMTRRRLITSLGAMAALALSTVVASGTHAQAQAINYQSLHPVQKRHVSGLLSTVLNGEDSAGQAVAAAKIEPAGAGDNYQPGPHGCPNKY